MKKIILSALIGVLPTTLLAQSKITDFTVFSKTNIDYARSDFGGRVGAGENIKVTDFLFTIANYSGVLAGNNFTQNRGTINASPLQVGGEASLSTVQGNIDIFSTKVKLDFTHITGNITASSLLFSTHGEGHSTSVVAGTFNEISTGAAEAERIQLRNYLSGLSDQMDNLSNTCKNLHGKKVVSNRGKLHLNGYSSLNVFEVSADEIIKADEIVFNVNPLSTTVINISGSNVEFVQLGMKVGTTDYRKVIWNMHEAQTLRITRSGSNEILAPNGHVGLPGVFLAPEAVTDFTEARITGSIFVKDLDGNKDGEHGGQVDYGTFNGNPCVRRPGGKG